MCGCLPTELFEQFKAEGFRAFSIERSDVDVHKCPRIDTTNFTAKPVYIVISTSDAYDCGTVNEGCNDFADLKIRGDKEKAVQFRDGGVCRNSVGEIAGGRTGDSVKVEFLRFAQGDCDNSIFKGKRRMANGVVFDIDFLNPERVCEIFGANEGCEPGVFTIRRFTIYRQEICITPHTFGTALY